VAPDQVTIYRRELVERIAGQTRLDPLHCTSG
jgi:hypothetical protein